MGHDIVSVSKHTFVAENIQKNPNIFSILQFFLSMQLIDTHAHLYLREFGDKAETIQKAIEAGVNSILLPGIDSRTLQDMLNLVNAFPNVCRAMIGLHPCSVKENYREELSVVEKWLEEKRFIAVGEIGIDRYWDKTFVREQQEAFHYQIKLAIQYELPIAIHSRDAFNETMEVLHDYKGILKGVWHCFTGNAEQAQQLIEFGGFMMGIGGVVTYKNAGLDKVVAGIPIDYLVLETDAPYLTPHPHRGKRNESSYIPLIAKKVAEIQRISLEEVAHKTTSNARRLFSLPE